MITKSRQTTHHHLSDVTLPAQTEKRLLHSRKGAALSGRIEVIGARVYIKITSGKQSSKT